MILVWWASDRSQGPSHLAAWTCQIGAGYERCCDPTYLEQAQAAWSSAFLCCLRFAISRARPLLSSKNSNYPSIAHSICCKLGAAVWQQLFVSLANMASHHPLLAAKARPRFNLLPHRWNVSCSYLPRLCLDSVHFMCSSFSSPPNCAQGSESSPSAGTLPSAQSFSQKQKPRGS